ncbi:Hpt domain-containing protein [Robertkochia solimangrovi]|uniref:Hpt domain-containing protein n=1 Tax=Robertkochia solimangrovi TaxID=2213046 RepID=UPI00117F83A6|nr:Hpt domain-containing protein [Robertkochia solimangrovi]TRZ41805.1 Hpt domain-containing protein [Robertkochia solimangrovi]
MTYDLSKLNELSGGDEDFNKSIVEVFMAETPDDAVALESSVAAVDFDKIYQHAHKIKPNADLLGITEARDALLAIEGHARGDQDIAKIKSLLKIVLDELNSAYPYFKNYIA